MGLFDTICAPASAMQEAGIGIIRISGTEAVPAASRILRTGKGNVLDIHASHRVKHGFVCDTESGEILDEVIVLTMKGPHSYTGEDTVEIQCHGGILLERRILELCLRQGLRLAEPGEFTKRAFLNGRIDLSEAEAVSELISAKSDLAMKASVRQLRGSVSDCVKEARAQILEDMAYIEAALDDPEHISLEGFSEKLLAHVSSLRMKLQKLIATAEDGKILKEGIRTVIVGKPNAGKSSLLNMILGEERAIVTEIAGTTRDTLEEQITLSGLNLRIMDTAGIRDTGDKVEKIGVERARKAVTEADLVLYVADASVPADDNDRQIIQEIGNKKCIILLNKSDLPMVLSEEEMLSLWKKAVPDSSCRVILISARERTGGELLREAIEEMFYHGEIHYNDEVIITSERHKACLIHAENALCEVENSVTAGMPEDFFSIDLMQAYTELGYILGEEVSEDLIDEIFRKFCMGK